MFYKPASVNYILNWFYAGIFVENNILVWNNKLNIHNAGFRCLMKM